MTDLFLDQALRDTLPEDTVANLKARAIMYEKWYNAGLIAAARRAEAWVAAAEANGGQGDMGYRNLASAIRDMQRK